MTTKRFLILFMLLVVFSFVGCTSDSGSADGDTTDGDQTDGDSDLPAGMVKLNGSVEKGPFVLGSSITISPVDESGNPTGQQFTTQTFNDMGEFSVNFEASGFVSLEGSGFYYNEVTGDLSGANLTLRAFYEIVSDGVQNAHLNLLTHLTYNRVKTLVQEGKSIADAIEQAEDELVEALPIGPVDFTLDNPAIELTLQGGDTLENAYLFSVSAVLAHAARLRSPASPDAALQELINGISADLANDGEISPSTVQKLVEAQTLPLKLEKNASSNYLIPKTIMAGLEARFSELGSSAVVPNLNRVLDSDFDSIANADDNCWWLANSDQKDENSNDIGDACDITFTDKDTGLVWQNISTYQMDEYYDFGEKEWTEAAAYCANLDFAGQTDWRMPSVDALRSLVSDCPKIQSNGTCKLHNNCLLSTDGSDGSNKYACYKNCSPCEKTDSPYWKNGVQGATFVWAAQESPNGNANTYWTLNFDTAEFKSRFIVLDEDTLYMTVRCVRGHSSKQELLCDDEVDDDGDGMTDCEDDDCFAVSSGEVNVCDNILDLHGINSAEFQNCSFMPECKAISQACAYWLDYCVSNICQTTCGEGIGGGQACIDCKNACYPSRFGTFTCDLEPICFDNTDNDNDSFTDMSDPDCMILAGDLPDGDIDGDVDGDIDGNVDGDTDEDTEIETNCPSECNSFAGKYCFKDMEGAGCESAFEAGNPEHIYAISYPKESCRYVLSEVSDPEMTQYTTVNDCNFSNAMLEDYHADIMCVANFSSNTDTLLINCTDGEACSINLTKTACIGK